MRLASTLALICAFALVTAVLFTIGLWRSHVEPTHPLRYMSGERGSHRTLRGCKYPCAMRPMPVLPEKLCIVVPFRDGCTTFNQGKYREINLHMFRTYMHSHFLRANPMLNYTIIVAEQVKRELFNRGQLMNAGFVVGKMRHNCTYFVFHDVDHLPLSFENTYANIAAANQIPYRLSSGASQYDYKLAYENQVGGAIMFTREQFEAINGFTNLMYGWGKEDDNLIDRIKAEFGSVGQAVGPVGHYYSVGHNSVTQEQHRVLVKYQDKMEILKYQRNKLTFGRKELEAISDKEAELRKIPRPEDDGLSSLGEYQVGYDEVVVQEAAPDYERFIVEILSRNKTRAAECA